MYRLDVNADVTVCSLARSSRKTVNKYTLLIEPFTHINLKKYLTLNCGSGGQNLFLQKAGFQLVYS